MSRFAARARRCTAVLLLVSTAACAGAAVSGDAVPAARPDRATDEPQLAVERRADGRGTLRQDDVTVTLQAGALLVKLTPLDEAVTKLLAPDTEQRLRALAEAHRAAADAVAATAALFLVSYFSYEPTAAFDAAALQLEHRGRLLRAVRVLPVTGGFGAQRVEQQVAQLGVYVFDHPIDYDQPITVRYGSQQSDAWARIIPRLEAERILLRSRSPR